MPKTTTPKSYLDKSPNYFISVNNLNSYNGLSKEQRAMQELQNLLAEEMADTKKLIIAYAITLGPLAVCLICCMCSYLMAFTRNLKAHAGSPLLPLITHSYRTLKFNYISFFMFGICAGISMSMGNLFLGQIFLQMFVIFALAITWYVAMYQIIISIIFIHRFINSRQSPELRGILTRKNVIVLMIIVFLLVIFKDIGMVVWMVVLMIGGGFNMGTIFTFTMYYSMIYITHQILLFIATIFQFCISEEPKTHSEYCVVTHTKYIGLVKMILGIICFASYLLNFETTIASTLFFGIDIFLVPVVIQITEIRANPNVITPTEIQKEPLKV
ncbi:hypothetical protein B9Z55_018160 [Caenorhabditis nigoni]|uniref:Serpentine receptor class gamma n=2 Tax=Caenorhabditis nigoni TaxID=1611254 RepID=A0A2G5TCJ8_9PELO|nr:hypothetical protein B9Z55_018160 [Caenorhabditis nigoni]